MEKAFILSYNCKDMDYGSSARQILKHWSIDQVESLRFYLIFLRELQVVIGFKSFQVIRQVHDGNRRVVRHACGYTKSSNKTTQNVEHNQRWDLLEKKRCVIIDERMRVLLEKITQSVKHALRWWRQKLMENSNWAFLRWKENVIRTQAASVVSVAGGNEEIM